MYNTNPKVARVVDTVTNGAKTAAKKIESLISSGAKNLSTQMKASANAMVMNNLPLQTFMARSLQAEVNVLNSSTHRLLDELLKASPPRVGSSASTPRVGSSSAPTPRVGSSSAPTPRVGSSASTPGVGSSASPPGVGSSASTPRVGSSSAPSPPANSSRRTAPSAGGSSGSAVRSIERSAGKPLSEMSAAEFDVAMNNFHPTSTRRKPLSEMSAAEFDAALDAIAPVGGTSPANASPPPANPSGPVGGATPPMNRQLSLRGRRQGKRRSVAPVGASPTGATAMSEELSNTLSGIGSTAWNTYNAALRDDMAKEKEPALQIGVAGGVDAPMLSGVTSAIQSRVGKSLFAGSWFNNKIMLD